MCCGMASHRCCWHEARAGGLPISERLGRKRHLVIGVNVHPTVDAHDHPRVEQPSAGQHPPMSPELPLFIFRKQSAGRVRGSCPGEITLGMRESLGHGGR